MSFKLLAAALASTLLLAGCAGKREIEGDGSLKTSYLPTPSVKAAKDADDPVPLSPVVWMRTRNPMALAGRTVSFTPGEAIHLGHKEVALTFDDGPMPGKTPRILATLDDFGVKATFLMVGQMASTYPSIARDVAKRGHTVGSHTFDHKNLAAIGYDAAMADIQRGEKAVAKAIGEDPAVFRFPYLSDTRRLRSGVVSTGTAIVDVDVDSKDYFTSSPAQIATRTMAAVRKHGGGIILMHDIHARTASMLPALLSQLKAEGYKVVSLKPKSKSKLFEVASAS